MNIKFFYACFLIRLKNDLLMCIVFPRHKISLKSFGKRAISNVLWTIFLQSIQWYWSKMKRELVFGSLKSPPVNGVVKINPFGVGVLAWSGLMWALLAEQQLPCSCYMAGRFHSGKELNVGPSRFYVCKALEIVPLQSQTAPSHLLTFWMFPKAMKSESIGIRHA